MKLETENSAVREGVTEEDLLRVFDDDDARGGFVILTAIRFRRNDGTPKKDEHSLHAGVISELMSAEPEWLWPLAC